MTWILNKIMNNWSLFKKHEDFLTFSYNSAYETESYAKKSSNPRNKSSRSGGMTKVYNAQQCEQKKQATQIFTDQNMNIRLNQIMLEVKWEKNNERHLDVLWSIPSKTCYHLSHVVETAFSLKFLYSVQ